MVIGGTEGIAQILNILQTVEFLRTEYGYSLLL